MTTCERLTEEVEGQLQVLPGTKKPLDQAVEKHMASPEVAQFLMPLPAPPPPPVPAKGIPKGGKGNKGKGKDKGGKSPRVVIPDGCSA